MLFAVFRGWGFLAIGYLVVCVLGANLLVDGLLGPRTFESTFVYPGIAIFLAGALAFVTGRRLNRIGPVPIFRRRSDAAEFSPRLRFLFAPHSFIFVPLEAWGVFEMAAGVFAVVRAGLHI